MANPHIALHTLHVASFKTSLTSPFALRKRKQLFASIVMMPAASGHDAEAPLTRHKSTGLPA